MVELRTSTQITFSWEEGAANGGATVTSYRVSFDQAVGSWQVLEETVTDTQYTVYGLQFGLTYQFRVEAENSYGFSEYSQILELLCAHVPDKPFVPSTLNRDESVVVDWNKPIEHGSEITGYKIYIR
jgi:hypothetical protein